MLVVLFDHNTFRQGVLVFSLLLIFILVQLLNKPYYTKRLQKLHVLGQLMCLQYVLWKLVIEGLSRYSADFNAATKTLV
jgi:hypothetical protein